MRIFTVAGTTLTLMTLGVAISAGNPSSLYARSATSKRPVLVRAQRSTQHGAAQRAQASAPCPTATDYGGGTNGFDYFVGVTDSSTDNTSSGQYSAILGGYGNIACGPSSGIGAGVGNEISGEYGFVGGGLNNYGVGNAAAVTAGFKNIVGGGESLIGAGYENNVQGAVSFIGAGEQNTVTGEQSAVSAGVQNAVGATASFVGSGSDNSIATNAPYSVVVGGVQNQISGNAGYITVGGGLGNLSSGKYATIPGGYRNEANGTLSFAAGYRAEALNSGSFVWSDYTNSGSPLSDTAPNEFLIRSSGGVYFYSNEADTAGVSLAPGSGTWSSLSDRNAKSNFAAIDDAAVLAKVVALPVGTWQYRSEAGVRHLGPMAQDFYSSFGIGTDDRHITAIDEDGVALASIKALHRENLGLRQSIVVLQREKSAEVEELNSRLAALEAKVAKISLAARSYR